MPLSQLLAQVKKAGGRLTKVRQAVLEYLSQTEQPISASDIIIYLQKKGIAVNKTTVYRELAFLTKHALITEVSLIGQASRFELSGQHRHHLICLKCQNIEAVNLEENFQTQEKMIMKTKKFRILSHALEFYGLCKKCGR